MNASPNDTENCLNCDAPMSGPYCSQCGQAQSARLLPIQNWLSEFSGTFLKLDSKLLRTMKRILFQPGLATVDFGKGKRVPYSGPIKTYIVVSAISIAAMTLQGAFSQGGTFPGVSTDVEVGKRIQFLFPFINLLSPFVTAGVLALFQSRFYFQLHLAFSLHYWTFLIAISTPMIFISPTSIWSLIAFSGLCLASMGYLFLAHQRVYVTPLFKRIFVCGAVLFSILLALVGASFFLITVASL